MDFLTGLALTVISLILIVWAVIFVASAIIRFFG